MPEFFLELFSEEIPARMQEEAAEKLLTVCWSICGRLLPENFRTFCGPRRIAVSGAIAAEQPSSSSEERGPRDSAPEQALAGFLRKHNASREELVTEAGYYVLRRNLPPISAQQVLIEWLPRTLAIFSWPKSMRWGTSGDFSWVRPLRRIVCLLDGEVIPLAVGPVKASNETEGHRGLVSRLFTVSSAADWQDKLRTHYVITDQEERKKIVAEGIKTKAAGLELSVADDQSLLDEVTGLVEWPVPLIGKIDQKFMDLPAEVRELSMKVNQKYFALRDADGKPAPYFAFVANLEAPDGGAAIIAGNERVLRARLSDARHFWDLDLKMPLEGILPRLSRITFHANIGTQYDRALRLEKLSGEIAESLFADGQEVQQARLAGRWCKADLVTGMVGEFPELQGVMGGYYAEHWGQNGPNGIVVGQAIKTHYQPKGPSDVVPTGTVAVSVALADKLDTLVAFFRINEKPTGSGDPYALRRASLGVIRIILENNLRLPLRPLLEGDESLFDFIIERLRVKLRGEGKRFDVLDAVLAASLDDDLVRIMNRVNAVTAFLKSEDGIALLVAYKRAANILKSQEAKYGETVELVGINLDENTPPARTNRDLLREDAEKELFWELVSRLFSSDDNIRAEKFGDFMKSLAGLRPFIDAFFQYVTIDDPSPELRLNRLRLLAQFRDAVHQIADFSKIEG